MNNVTVELTDNKLSAMVILNVLHLQDKYTPTYHEPTMVDGIKLFLSDVGLDSSGIAPYTSQILKLDDASLQFLHKVPLTYYHGSTNLYLLPLLVYTNDLPEFCNRNNVQNYSKFNPVNREDLNGLHYTKDEVYKTLRSVGLPPKLLFKHLKERLDRLKIVTPGNDVINFLMTAFFIRVTILEDFLCRMKIDQGIQAANIVFVLDGPERDLAFKIMDLINGTDNIEGVIKRLYYKLYTSWFDDSTFTIVDGARIHVAHHSVWEVMSDIKDLTIHPSIQLGPLIEKMAIRISKDKNNLTPPADFKSYIVNDENAHQIVSSIELKSEGAYMHHCVGGDSYQHRLHQGSQIYFHLNLPNAPHGATLSMCRFDFSNFGKAFRIKGVSVTDWWVVDQYYGFCDKNMKHDTEAMVVLDNFIEQHFDELTIAQFGGITRNNDELMRLKKLATTGRCSLWDTLGFGITPFTEMTFGASGRLEFVQDVGGQELLEAATELTNAEALLREQETRLDFQRALGNRSLLDASRFPAKPTELSQVMNDILPSRGGFVPELVSGQRVFRNADLISLPDLRLRFEP